MPGVASRDVEETRRRWVVLAVGTFAQAATSAAAFGIPTIVPALQDEDGLSLVRASVVVSAPSIGLLATLILWGAAADRFGERVVIVSGVGLSSLFLAAAAMVPGFAPLVVCLALAGAAGASVNAASGRLVLGWFSAQQRGLAMGIRQTAQPLGVAVAGLALPPLAAEFGPHESFWFVAGLSAAAAVAVLVLASDPPRPPRVAGAAKPRSPYRGSIVLPRLHAASAMLVFPQFAVASFTVVYLVSQRHWDATAAGRVVFAFSLAGALGRIGSGVWSDRVSSRLRPMRQLAVLSAATMLLTALAMWTHSWLVVAAFALGSVITVADNGLAYTATAEIAGPAWAGRAIGTQNTVQNVASLTTAPALAAIIGDSRYALAFALVAVLPMIAVFVTPVPGA